jgi:3-mercaptopyruvate sulfurtransferase SseA
MTFTTLISTGELESMLGGPSLVLLDARFSLDDEEWGTAAYGEAHIPGALRADLNRLEAYVASGKVSVSISNLDDIKWDRVRLDIDYGKLKAAMVP